MLPLSLHGATRIVTPSASTRDDLLSGHASCAPKIDVVPEAPAFDDDSASGAPPSTRPYGLIVGNISPNKNAAIVVDALALLAKRGLDVQIVHIGRDEAGVLAEAQARQPLPSPILSMHGVSDGQLRMAYEQARFFLNTSLHEGFCLPVVEAQACGAPVIVSRRSALPEVAGDGALYVDPTSAAEIAAAIAAVWTEPGLAETLRMRGSANARRFSWERTARMTSDVLDLAAKEWAVRRGLPHAEPSRLLR